MQNEIAPEPPNTPQTTEPEADAQAARLVTERLNEITTRARREGRLFLAQRGAIYCVTILLPLLILYEFGLRDPNILPLAVLLYSLSFFFTYGIVANLPRGTVWLDAEGIASLGGAQAVAPLFSALQSPLFANQKQAIQAALTALLPQMKASDARLMTPACRRVIHGWLTIRPVEIGVKSHHNDLRVAALKALEQVGDSQDIPVVEQVAITKHRAPDFERVRRAALDCLPMLRANCGGVETARTLLRASQSEDVRPDTLLRPPPVRGRRTRRNCCAARIYPTRRGIRAVKTTATTAQSPPARTEYATPISCAFPAS